MPDSRFILIGKLLAAHGTAGGLKLHSYAESLDPFAPGLALLAVGAGGFEQRLEVQQARPLGRASLMMLKGVTTRSQAEALAGCELFIDKQALPALEEGAYYWSDLIGLDVYADAGRFLGKIESIFRTGANDVYTVKNEKTGREILIPALKTVIAGVDVPAGRMDVVLPEGLE